MRRIVVLVVAVLGLSACSASDDATSPETSVSEATGVVSYTLDGIDYPADVYECAQAVWDERVNEWNQLTQQRDAQGLPNGKEWSDFEDWATGQGYELTVQEAVKTAAAGECKKG